MLEDAVEGISSNEAQVYAARYKTVLDQLNAAVEAQLSSGCSLQAAGSQRQLRYTSCTTNSHGESLHGVCDLSSTGHESPSTTAPLRSCSDNNIHFQNLTKKVNKDRRVSGCETSL